MTAARQVTEACGLKSAPCALLSAVDGGPGRGTLTSAVFLGGQLLGGVRMLCPASQRPGLVFHLFNLSSGGLCGQQSVGHLCASAGGIPGGGTVRGASELHVEMFCQGDTCIEHKANKDNRRHLPLLIDSPETAPPASFSFLCVHLRSLQ